MPFAWDPARNASNRRKHGVSFEEARAVFDDPGKVEWLCSDPEDDKDRSMMVGMVGWNILAVVYTPRGGATQLISVRKANRNERRENHQGKAHVGRRLGADSARRLYPTA